MRICSLSCTYFTQISIFLQQLKWTNTLTHILWVFTESFPVQWETSHSSRETSGSETLIILEAALSGDRKSFENEFGIAAVNKSAILFYSSEEKNVEEHNVWVKLFNSPVNGQHKDTKAGCISNEEIKASQMEESQKWKKGKAKPGRM